MKKSFNIYILYKCHPFYPRPPRNTLPMLRISFTKRDLFILLYYTPNILLFCWPFSDIRNNDTQNPTIDDKESQAGKPQSWKEG